MMIEKHPFEPWLPENAKILMLGSFPPQPKRWKFKFYYPNFTNDMWRIMGLLFFDDKEYFVVRDEKTFDLEKIKRFLKSKGIAMYDTAEEVRRLKDNASDKFLEIIRPTNLPKMLDCIPQCKAIIVTGKKAGEEAAAQFGVKVPGVGEYTSITYGERELKLWRMPSSSRAYPLKLEKKAEQYAKVFKLF